MMDAIVITPGNGDTPEFCEWLKQHGVEPRHCYKAEIYHDYMVVYVYGLNAEGNKGFNKDTQEIEKLAPAKIKLQSPMPS